MNNYKLVYQTTSSTLAQMGFNGQGTIIIAGPCSVEDEESLMTYIKYLQDNGINYMRAGAFKPRTSPYNFQGLGYDALMMLKRVKEKTGIKLVTEITDPYDLPLFEEIIDILQIGTRNMQNFTLLKAIGKSSLPIILKRGFGNTVEEWLGAAEYILLQGNPNIIFCERGIKTFETATRNTLDLSSVVLLKQMIKLPVIVDPSHATGRRELVPSLSLASLASGADGLLIEVHYDPKLAKSDGEQALPLPEMSSLLYKIDKLLPVFNKYRF